MLGANFTGQHRKPRNINLGGRNAGGFGSRDSVLRKAQQERERREQSRRQERAAIVIQSYYRGRRDVHEARLRVQADWDGKYLINMEGFGGFGGLGESSFNMGPQELRSCLRQFQFFYKPLLSSEKNSLQIVQRLRVLYLILDSNNPKLIGIPVDSLQELASQLSSNLRLTNESTNIQHIKVLTIQIFNLLVNYDLPSEILLDLSNFTASITTLPADELHLLRFELKRLVQQFTTVHSHSFVKNYLSTEHLFDVFNESPPFDNIYDLRHLTLETLANNDFSLDDLPNDRKVWLLSNLISLDFSDTSPILYIAALHKVLSSISVQFRIESPPSSKVGYVSSSADSDVPNNSRYRHTSKSSPFFKTSDQTLVKNFTSLYTRDFIIGVFQLLSENIDYINLLASFYVSLIRFFPSKKTDLILYLSLGSGNGKSAVHLFWLDFKNSSIYNHVLEQVPVLQDLERFADDSTAWNKLVLILELYSYWLIVADDSEFMANTSQGFPMDEIFNLSQFLKNLSYFLIWNWTRIEGSQKINNSDITFKRLKDISILVMRQIYIRDSRRPFLDKDFWLMTRNFDMEMFIPAVVEEEERRIEALYSSRDSESEEDEVDNRSSLTSRTTTVSARSKSEAPRLEILKQAPFFMPFNLRVHVFEAFIALDRERNNSNNVASMLEFALSGVASRHHADIRRENLLQDAFNGFNSIGSSFKQPISVTFYNQHGPEAGIDGGGITKEFLTSVCREAFDPSVGLFSSTRDHLLYPNPQLGVLPDISDSEGIGKRQKSLEMIRFLGKVIGKCMYEGILVDVEFAPFFLQKWAGSGGAGYKNSFDDMYSLDPEIYENLVKLHKYPGDVESDLGLNFTITQDVGDGKLLTVELRPGGENIPVTNSNRLEYIHAVANYKLNQVLHPQTSYFLAGMSEMISLNWLSMFNANELQMLISGGRSDIDIQDLKENTEYGIYSESSQTVKYFWEVVEEMDTEDQHRLIKFVTSVAKAPLLGFSQLRPKFGVRMGDRDLTRLPTSSTCVNLLKLPDYKNKEQLRRKLLYSIRADAGFDLS